MEKRGMVLLAIILALTLTAPVRADDFNTTFTSYRSLELGVNIENKFKIVPESGGYSIEQVKASLSWFPRQDYRQAVSEIYTRPDSELEGDYLVFEWRKPSNPLLNIDLRTTVETKSDAVKISKKIVFPLQGLDSSLSSYVEPQEIIDMNDGIRNLAFELSEGKTDLFDVVFLLADWVHSNIQYNMSTVTSEASQKSSWVLENRRGVCDELTSLFISLNRALGIPARFVSGVAYTNIHPEDGWGPHGWAEVYFPGYGWVPFDVTYGQLGYVDAGHIKLSESKDAKQSSIEYEYTGRNIGISAMGIDVDVTLKSVGEKKESSIEATIEMLHENAGFGSYNLVIATLKNNADYYAAADVKLAKTTDVEIITGEKSVNVLFKPREEKKVFWIVKLDSGMDSDFFYTFPIVLYVENQEKAETQFGSKISDPVFQLSDIERFVENAEKENEMKYSEFITISCSAKDSRIYLDENAEISCTIMNSADMKFQNLKVCLDDECSAETIGKEKTINYSKRFDKPGIKNLVFKVEGDKIFKTGYVLIFVVNKPEVEMAAEYPKTASYDDELGIKIRISNGSESIPENVNIILEHANFGEEWAVAALDKEQILTLNFPAKMLDWGNNRIELTANYQDDDGAGFTQQQELMIDFNKATFFQRLWLKMNKWGYGLERFLGFRE